MLLLTQAQYAAEGAIELAVSNLLTASQVTWPADGTVQQFQIANAQVQVAIYDEAGRIDLNFASADLLNNLLETAGVEADQRMSLVDAIMDWRDSDDMRRLNGAEDDDYSAAGLPYGAKDAKFDTVDELGLVLGMRPEIVQAIQTVLTVYSRQPGINPAVASAQALQAYSAGDSAAVDAYITQRTAPSDGTANFEPEFIDRRLVSTAGSSVYTIHVESRVEETIVARVAATVVLMGGRELYNVLSWKQPTTVLIAEDSMTGGDSNLDRQGWDSNE
jgi:general secretion pathway protein K